MLMRFTSVQAANNNNTTTMGIVNEFIEPITPGCSYDLSLFMAARKGYGYSANSTPPSYEVTISVGHDLHLACGSLNVVTGTVITSLSGTITHGTSDVNPDSVWNEISSSMVFSEAYNSILITVKMAGFPTGSKYDVYLDDISLVKEDIACGVTCCNAECPSDLNCDGITNPDDLGLFLELIGLTVGEIENPCYQLADFNSDGIVDSLDASAFSFGPCTGCCSTTCLGDFNCDGVVNATDHNMLLNEIGNAVTDLNDPCMADADFVADGLINPADNLYFIGHYLNVPCPSGMTLAPTTARTLDDRIGHVLNATADPNPGVGQYRIAHQLPGEGAIDITVVDHQGRVVVRRSAADQPTLLLDLQDQQPGTYTAVLVRNENLSTVRLVKD